VFERLSPIRIWFCIAAALVAASIADPLIEFASNSGAFGPGSFTDHSNWDVFPALGAGIALAAIYIGLRVRRTFVRADVHDGLRPSALLSLLPYVFAAQIALLYVMETVEQFAVAGHALGGLIWLGGPAPVSLAVHAVICVVTTLLLGRLACRLARSAASFVAHIIAAIAVVPRSAAATFTVVSRRADARRRPPLLSRTGLRAPPPLPA
jgi:hypothetical protein